MRIECLVTTYGIPFRVGRREPLEGFDTQLKQLRQSLQEEKDAILELEKKGDTKSLAWQGRRQRIEQMQTEMVQCPFGGELLEQVRVAGV